MQSLKPINEVHVKCSKCGNLSTNKIHRYQSANIVHYAYEAYCSACNGPLGKKESEYIESAELYNQAVSKLEPHSDFYFYELET